MEKIKCLFTRNFNTGIVFDEVTQGCEWVASGDGWATLKHDGTSCMFRDNKFYKRRMVKKGKKAPSRFIPCTYDENTGKTFGWVPVDPDDPVNKYHMIALGDGGWGNGTYELVGPKINGNSDHHPEYMLLKHGAISYDGVPRRFDALAAWFKGKDIEGLVFYNKAGDMVKIKKGDFGMGREE